MPVRRRGAKSSLQWNPLDTPKATLEEAVRLRLDPIRDGVFRRPAAGRVVLEATVMGRIVRRRDHDTVGQPGRAPVVVGENRMRDDRGRGVFVSLREHDLHSVGRQHLERAGKSRDRERVGVHAEKQRAIDLLPPAVQANGLGDGEDVPFVEGPVECGAAMSRGAEHDPLRRHGRIGTLRVVGGDECGHVDQHRWFRGFSCQGAHVHRHISSRGRPRRRQRDRSHPNGRPPSLDPMAHPDPPVARGFGGRVGPGGASRSAPSTTRTRCARPSSESGIAAGSAGDPSSSALATPPQRRSGFSTTIV